MVGEPLGVAVFASGGGSNLQSLLDHQKPDGPWQIRVVVSDRVGAGALERARARGVATRVILVRGRDASEVARDTLTVLDEHAVGLVLLAGYLRLVPPAVVAAYRGRILNIHPALLPSFGGKGMYGMNVHRAVLESGVHVTGPTVHVVDEEYDRGSIVAQWPVPVLPDDTPETLQRRVLEVEHRLYPRVADHAAACVKEGRPVGPLVLAAGGWEPVGGANALERHGTGGRGTPPA